MINGPAAFVEALLKYTYLQQATAAALLVGISCGVIGCFIILRNLALMGEAISHAVLPGVVISYLLQISYFLGAVFTGVLTALGIGYISQNSKIDDDTAIGILFTAAFALGIVMITAIGGTGVNLWNILFGNVLAVSRGDLLWTAAANSAALVGILLLHRELIISTFDPVGARTLGIATDRIHYALMLLLSVVIVASLQTVGIILVVAMLITPAATAFLLTERLPVMVGLSAAVGAAASVVGVYASFIYDVATGGSIVVVTSLLFLIAFILSRFRADGPSN